MEEKEFIENRLFNNREIAEEYYYTRCEQKALELGYIFSGFYGDWRASKTRIKLVCQLHGEWNTGTVKNLINKNTGCPRCKAEQVAKRFSKPDSTMIASFFASGAFHPDTKFWRSERINSQGVRCHWFLLCGACDTLAESSYQNLQRGFLPCDCSGHRQIYAYINLIKDSNNLIAIKFGITNHFKIRFSQQNAKSIYDIVPHSLYLFPDHSSCKSAERDCRYELECGVVLKRDMPDGYTETTYPYNLEKIIKIYERNGGMREDFS